MFDFNSKKFSSQRRVVLGRRGMVAATQPLAASSGLRMIQSGGNAYDAALACAAALTVVEPTSNGLGGDCFALFSRDGEIKGMNSSGWLPEDFNRSEIDNLSRKKDQLDPYSWEAVTIPGQLAGWKYLKDEYGSLSWQEILKPAIELAEKGFPVSPVVAECWNKELNDYKDNLSRDHLQTFLETFTVEGRAPAAGEIWKCQDQARTLKILADEGMRCFYEGRLAERIAAHSSRTEGYISEDDLEKFSPNPVDPLSIDYRGHKIYELPPNGQGLIALQSLKILQDYGFDCVNDPAEVHLQIEALKRAFADGEKYIADPEFFGLNPEKLLDDDYIDDKRKNITDSAQIPRPGNIDKGGTVYLAAADHSGNMISFIQSNYKGFGSGIVIPGTGIALHNRGCNFTLDKKSANYPEPGKKPYHTIIPGFYSSPAGSLQGPFGVMGGFMQPQGHLQVLQKMIDYDLNPQEALDAPRWCWQDDNHVLFEPEFDHDILNKLAKRGHEVEYGLDRSVFGRGQIIFKDMADNTLIGAAESRADGQVAVY
ncbi:gamma-glutamyltransferase family protein [Halarsenatibacter silvermanii]|uniref:Gamma-glutamyltransferase 2. Threonine peptidase. MEROPS family T03 n=1 Tax=Halarsenatibacter silvermanii TaxID=321763 RepID=A0A1G9NRV1_9FIRM|nr:gamma-glutamyltransferase family protein [Halarsenatibacter silvermanii]SDL89336.1 gamma-glutamyltransferase 2. Threonine peptidase. MEROPS family T03 [Halarsenatibacter silvermanii]